MDRRVSKTKKAIQEAYFALLKEDRHRRITISEITRKADVDRKTFYLHYASIDDVIREFAKSKVDELIERVFSLEFPSDQLAIRVFNVFNQMISEYKEILHGCITGMPDHTSGKKDRNPCHSRSGGSHYPG